MTRGITLVETMIGIAITAMLILTAASLLNSAFLVQKRNRAVSEVEMQANMALSEIATSIRNASAITSPATSSSATTLTLALPSSTGLNPTIYATSTSLITVSEGGGAITPITSPNVTVTSLSFQNVSSTTARAVRVTMTVRYNNRGGRAVLDYANTYTTTVTLR